MHICLMAIMTIKAMAQMPMIAISINIPNDQAKTLANNAGVGYNSGYTNGNSAGKSSFNKTYNIRATWHGYHNGENQLADVTGSVTVHFNPYTGSVGG